MRPLRLTIALPPDIAEELKARIAEERADRIQPEGVTLEAFAVLAIGRYLHGLKEAPAYSLPLGPGLIALARYIHSEAIRREWIDASLSLDDFLQDAVAERLALIADYWMGGIKPGEARLAEGLDKRHDVTGDRPDGRWMLVR